MAFPGSVFRLVARTQSTSGGVGNQLHSIRHKRRNRSEPMVACDIDMMPWWKRVGTGMFVYKKVTLLLVVDYTSSHSGIAKLAETTSSDVILHLRSIFAQPVFPESVVFDNGPQ